MATSARNAHGSLLKIGDGGGGGEVFTTIAEVLDIDGPGMEASLIEVTNHDSAGSREYVTSLLDNGEVTFAINYYGAATQDQLRTDLVNRTRRNFQLVFPLSAPETWAFAGYVTKLQPKSPVDGALTADVTLKVTGGVTVS